MLKQLDTRHQQHQVNTRNIQCKRNATSKTIDELRLEMYSNCNSSNLVSLPPSSSAVLGHFQRSLYMVHICASVFSSQLLLNPLEYEWKVNEDDSLIPVVSLNEFDELLTLCGCTTRCTGRCSCLKLNMNCVTLCKCSAICNDK